MELITPLDGAEIDRLESLLKSGNALDLSTIDGLFTALVSAPTLTSPDEWLPVVFQTNEWQVQASDKIEQLYGLLVRHLNGIESILARAPDKFEPMFLERDLHDSVDLVVENWCRGYIKGIALCKHQWSTDSEFMQTRLYPIIVFGGKAGAELRNKADREQILSWKKAIPENIREIYTYWADSRPVFEKPTPFVRGADKPGRNQLCACGSGKKYKFCCGAH